MFGSLHVLSQLRLLLALLRKFTLNLSDHLHQGENWKSFRRKWKFYELEAGIHKNAQEIRMALLLNVIGKEGMDMYEIFQWGNSLDTLKIDKVLEKFEDRCVPERNELTKDMLSSNVSNCQMNGLIVT